MIYTSLSTRHLINLFVGRRSMNPPTRVDHGQARLTYEPDDYLEESAAPC